VNTYSPQAILPFMDREQPVISPLLSNVIAIAALLFTIWARLSPGRNIGFVPARREIVTAGFCSGQKWVQGFPNYQERDLFPPPSSQ
jgi:hypothetical protein